MHTPDRQINPDSFFAKYIPASDDETCTYCDRLYPVDELKVTRVINKRIGDYNEFCCLECEIKIKLT